MNDKLGGKYHTLLVRDPETGIWGAEFGDYNKSLVVLERGDVLGVNCKRKDTRIITTSPIQKDIDARIKELNGGV